MVPPQEVALPRRQAPVPIGVRADLRVVRPGIADPVVRREGPLVVPVARPVTGVPVDRAAIEARDRRAKIVAIAAIAAIGVTEEIGRRARR